HLLRHRLEDRARLRASRRAQRPGLPNAERADQRRRHDLPCGLLRGGDLLRRRRAADHRSPGEANRRARLGSMSGILRQPVAAIEELQSEKLRAMLALLAKGSRFYTAQWARAGVDVATIRGVQDLERLPLTFKKDLMADPEAFRLRVPDLPL